jgi:hypothetical protein
LRLMTTNLPAIEKAFSTYDFIEFEHVDFDDSFVIIRIGINSSAG